MKRLWVCSLILLLLVGCANGPDTDATAARTALSTQNARPPIATLPVPTPALSTAYGDYGTATPVTENRGGSGGTDGSEIQSVNKTAEAEVGGTFHYRTYVQTGYPRQSTDEVVWVVLTRDPAGKIPMVGMPVHTVWNYKTTTSYADWQTGNYGKAAMVRNIADATCGYTVRVDVYVFAEQKQIDSAYFTPCGDSPPPPPAPVYSPPQPPAQAPPPPPVQRTTGPVSGSGGVCPAGYPIKANDNSGIYHQPGQQFYNATNARNCFATAAAAERDGYRASKV